MNSKGGVYAASPAIRSIGSIDPYALKIPARRAESSLLFQFHILIFTLSQHGGLAVVADFAFGATFGGLVVGDTARNCDFGAGRI